jgi:ABC-type proline/glycine betaine transport system substrate-binding protein
MATQTTLDKTSSEVTVLEQTLQEYAAIPYARGDIRMQLITDYDRGRFLLVTEGWDGERRVHHIFVDVELRGDKFWIHRDGTEEGIATDLERAGIPKNRIVLAWHPEEVRHLTEYAVK